MMHGHPEIRVVLVDSHPIMVEGLRSLGQRAGPLPIAEVAASASEAIALVRLHKPAVVLLGNNLPDVSEVVEACLSDPALPGIRFVVLGDLAPTAGEPGRVAVLDPSADLNHVVTSLRQLAGLPPRDSVPDRSGAAGPARSGSRPPESILSERELEIASLVAAGRSNRSIAEEAGISIGTVKVHLFNIFGKLGVANRTSLAMHMERQSGRKASVGMEIRADSSKGSAAGSERGVGQSPSAQGS